MLSYALKYREAGFSVVPIKPDYDPIEGKFLKKPYISWKAYQTVLPTVEEITAWWTKWPKAMIGVVCGELTKLYGIDCDTEESFQRIQEMLPDTFATPMLKTPRGGHHFWVKCSNGTRLRSLSAVLPNIDTRGEGGYLIAPPSKNEHGQVYQWEEGLSVWDEAPQELPSSIVTSLRGGIIRGGNQEAYTTQDYKDYTILHKGNRDQDLFRIGMALADGKYKRGDIAQVLGILAKNCVPPFPEKELDEKVKSIFGRITTKERNLADEVKEWAILQEGYWNTTSIRHELQITTKLEIKNLSVIINRLQEDGIIEKHGEKRGEYRTKRADTSEMDLLTEESIEDVDVKLPLNLSEMCVLSPGNIIVVSGSKSAGKTAMMMNIAWLNQNYFDVSYLNSEMSQTEFKKRMKKFAPLDKWKIKGFKCHNNFEDYITSGKRKLFIIDYLEIHDNFFEIAKPIRKIHEKLGDSICFIAIQMKAGAELGRGGDFSAEKSRLYLTMDYRPEEKQTKIMIYDAKEPRPPHDNVRGKWRKVKIIDGHELSTYENWKW